MSEGRRKVDDFPSRAHCLSGSGDNPLCHATNSVRRPSQLPKRAMKTPEIRRLQFTHRHHQHYTSLLLSFSLPVVMGTVMLLPKLDAVSSSPVSRSTKSITYESQ